MLLPCRLSGIPFKNGIPRRAFEPVSVRTGGGFRTEGEIECAFCFDFYKESRHTDRYFGRGLQGDIGCVLIRNLIFQCKFHSDGPERRSGCKSGISGFGQGTGFGGSLRRGKSGDQGDNQKKRERHGYDPNRFLHFFTSFIRNGQNRSFGSVTFGSPATESV